VYFYHLHALRQLKYVHIVAAIVKVTAAELVGFFGRFNSLLLCKIITNRKEQLSVTGDYYTGQKCYHGNLTALFRTHITLFVHTHGTVIQTDKVPRLAAYAKEQREITI
jgi:hypothetical protein